jgi:hypothetical protein
MADDANETIRNVLAIFMPYAAERTKEATESGTRFVHYTSPENGIKIIRGKTFWLRDARCMNDYSEIHHGYLQLHTYFNDIKKKESFFSALNDCVPIRLTRTPTRSRFLRHARA